MPVLCIFHNANFFFLVCHYSTYPFCKAAVVGSYVSVIPAFKKKSGKERVDKISFNCKLLLLFFL